MASLIGHRGARLLSPENTLAGLRAAAACGADWAEVDARLSSDGVLVLMHDPTVDRTTDGSGKVEDLSLDELRGFSVGGEPLPTLEEATSLAGELGIGIVVEMKEVGLEALVSEALEGRTAMVTSFYHSSLWEIKELGRFKTGIIISSLPLDPVALALDVGADAIFPRLVNANLFKRAHHSGLEVYPWTINDASEAAWMLKLGADGLVTDDPCLLKGVLDRPIQDTSQENCAYYPCHLPGQDCTHCFCPLYPCRDPELGRYVRTKRGKRFWSCKDCDLVHLPEVARYLEKNPSATTAELKKQASRR